MSNPINYGQLQLTFADVINNVFSQGTLFDFKRPNDPADGNFTTYATVQGVFSQKENMLIPGGSFVSPPGLIDTQTNYLYVAGNNLNLDLSPFSPQDGDLIVQSSDSTQTWRLTNVLFWTPIPGYTMAFKLKVT